MSEVDFILEAIRSYQALKQAKGMVVAAFLPRGYVVKAIRLDGTPWLVINDLDFAELKNTIETVSDATTEALPAGAIGKFMEIPIYSDLTLALQVLAEGVVSKPTYTNSQE